jgi:hypothetical protein
MRGNIEGINCSFHLESTFNGSTNNVLSDGSHGIATELGEGVSSNKGQLLTSVAKPVSWRIRQYCYFACICDLFCIIVILWIYCCMLCLYPVVC